MIEKEELLKELFKIAQKLLEVGEKLNETVYDLYERAGCPYGETESGMLKWLRERREKKEDEYKNEYKKEIDAMIEKTIDKIKAAGENDVNS